MVLEVIDTFVPTVTENVHDVVTGTRHIRKVNFASVEHEIEVGAAQSAKLQTLQFGVVVGSASPGVFKDAQRMPRPLVGSRIQRTGHVVKIAPFLTRSVHQVRASDD